jgi:flagellar basal body rod protein FlgC
MMTCPKDFKKLRVKMKKMTTKIKLFMVSLVAVTTVVLASTAPDVKYEQHPDTGQMVKVNKIGEDAQSATYEVDPDEPPRHQNLCERVPTACKYDKMAQFRMEP